MNLQEFKSKHPLATMFLFDETAVTDVIMIIGSNLSDVQEMTDDKRIIDKLNSLKQFMFDFSEVVRTQQREEAVS